jgi:germination protein M
LAQLLTGCAGVAPERPQGNAGAEPHTFDIYYLDTELTRLASVPYQTETTDADALVDELLERFFDIPPDIGGICPIPTESVEYLGYTRQDIVLNVNFDVNYTDTGLWPAWQEVMARAALAKTLTQVEGIDYICIYTGDIPLMDTHGNPVGVFGPADFIGSVEDVDRARVEAKEATDSGAGAGTGDGEGKPSTTGNDRGDGESKPSGRGDV